MSGTQPYVEAIETALRGDPSGETCTTLHASSDTVVYRVNVPQTLVVRIAPAGSRGESTQQAVMAAIAAADGLTSKILHSERRTIEGVPRSIQVMTYLPGKPLDHLPSLSETHAIAQAMHTLHVRLCSVSSRFEHSDFPRLIDVAKDLTAASEEGPMKDEARRLLETPRFCALANPDRPCLIYGDPWPLNLLVEEHAGRCRVRIADVDPLLFGPAILQPAMLFSACFVMASLLHPPEGIDPLDPERLFAAWPAAIDPQDTLLMMRVYPILLSLQKSLAHKQRPNGAPRSLQRNLDLLARCLVRIDEWSQSQPFAGHNAG